MGEAKKNRGIKHSAYAAGFRILAGGAPATNY